MRTTPSRYVAECPSCVVNGFKPRRLPGPRRQTFERFDVPEDVGDPYVCSFCDTAMRCPEPKCGAPMEWSARRDGEYRWLCPWNCDVGNEPDESERVKPGTVDTIVGPLGVATIVLVLSRAARDGNPWGRWNLHVRVRGRGRVERSHLRALRWRRGVPQGFPLVALPEQYPRMVRIARHTAAGCVGVA